jgi:hypothetical protein
LSSLRKSGAGQHERHSPRDRGRLTGRMGVLGLLDEKGGCMIHDNSINPTRIP